MSIESMCAVHTVAVYTSTASVGAQMGVNYAVAPAGRSLDCNVQQGNAMLSSVFDARGMKVDYTVHFSADPSLTTSNLLLYEGKYLRVLGVFKEARIDGTWSLWIAPCEVVTQRGDGS